MPLMQYMNRQLDVRPEDVRQYMARGYKMVGQTTPRQIPPPAPEPSESARSRQTSSNPRSLSRRTGGKS